MTPDLITILLGTNDFGIKDPKGHVPLKEYAENLIKIIAFFQKQKIPSHRLILITPPPRADRKTRKEQKSYRDACMKVADGHLITCVDIWERFVNADGDWESDLFVDGVHFSGKGNEIVGKAVQEVVETKLNGIKKTGGNGDGHDKNAEKNGMYKYYHFKSKLPYIPGPEAS